MLLSISFYHIKFGTTGSLFSLHSHDLCELKERNVPLGGCQKIERYNTLTNIERRLISVADSSCSHAIRVIQPLCHILYGIADPVLVFMSTGRHFRLICMYLVVCLSVWETVRCNR